MKTLSDRLKAAMDSAGVTQARLAESIGVAQPSIYKILSGKTLQSAFIVHMAKALGVRPEWLALGEGHMHKGNEAVISPVEKFIQDKSVQVLPVWVGDTKTKDLVPVPSSCLDESCKAYMLLFDSGFPGIVKGTVLVASKKIRPENKDYIYALVGGSNALFTYVAGGTDGFLSSADDRVPLIDLKESIKTYGVVTYFSIKTK